MQSMARMGRMRHRGATGRGLSLGLLLGGGMAAFVGLAGCAGRTASMDPGGGDCGFEYLGRVTRIEVIPDHGYPDLFRWTVEMEVVRILANPGGVVVIPRTRVEVHVESVVLTFREDRSVIVGKLFRVRYLEPFAEPYRGRVAVSPVKETDGEEAAP